MSILGKIVVGFVTFLILFIGYTAQYPIFIYFEGWNQDSIFFLSVYNIFVLLILYNYRLSCTVDPGRVPKNWEPKLDGPVLEVKKSNMKPRYCKTCRCYKPPRAHHCSTCERCVLKMDHHCPWLNNCVGYKNYGHFIRFIFYVVLATGMCFFVLVKRIFQLFDDMYLIQHRDSITTFELSLLVLNSVLAFPVLFCVSMLSIFQFYGMGEGTTTIEGWEKDKVASLVRMGKVSEVRFPYDIGIFANICSVLGDNILFWCIPQAMKGDGLSFPVTQYEDEGTIIWPPPEYSHESEKKKNRTLTDRNSDDELVAKQSKFPSSFAARKINGSPYTSFLDSAEESDEETSRFVGVSDESDESDDLSTNEEPRFSNRGYKKVSTLPDSADTSSKKDSPYDSDDAPIGALFQRNILQP